jgi:glutamyl-tRNA synthetase
VRQARPFLTRDITYDADAVAKQWKDTSATRELLTAARDALAPVDDWTAEALEPALRALAEARGIGAGKLFQPLRVALTGLAVSPGIFEVLVMLGRELALHRLDAATKHLTD